MNLKVNQEAVNLLKESTVFRDLPPEDLEEIAAMLDSTVCQAGEALFKEGDPGGKIYLVASGSVEVLKQRSQNSGQVVIARFERGSVIGEMSLVDGLPRSATVVATVLTKVYTLSKESFEFMTTSRKDLAIKTLLGVAKLLSLRLRNTSGWFADVF